MEARRKRPAPGIRQWAQGFRGKGQIYAMLLPNIIMFSLLSIYPIIWVLKYMFYQYDKIHDPIFIGLDNFVRAFTRDPAFWQSVFNTLVYVGGKLIITLPISFLIAVILDKKFRGSRLVQSLVFMPTIMSAAVMSLIFYLILNPYSGSLNQILQTLKIVKAPVNWLSYQNAMFSVIVVGAWGAIGNYMVYFLAGLQAVPGEIYESASLDGINSWQKMWYITLPMLSPVLKTVIMLALINSFQDMQSIMVLTEGGPNNATNVMFLYVYRMFFPISATTDSASQFGYGAALSVISSAIVGVITLLYLRTTRKMDDIY
ncbi:MAG TPA: sugar ABC transporter permease [Candidatus Limiplasma sp.]|mgnify:CR=1 FL=1|nr:sugar ABC transporter permease [Candidatus Limiplasma sp.]